MTISNCTTADIAEIFQLYRQATAYMRAKAGVGWPEFDPGMVESEIREKHQWKMVNENKIACIWATTFSDPLIWQEKNADPAVYIHRITTNADCRGKKLVVAIVHWAKQFATANGKAFIRLDTVGENPGLINHYTACGFQFLGLSTLHNTDGLPAHYHNATVSLFEIPLNKHH